MGRPRPPVLKKCKINCAFLKNKWHISKSRAYCLPLLGPGGSICSISTSGSIFTLFILTLSSWIRVKKKTNQKETNVVKKYVLITLFYVAAASPLHWIFQMMIKFFSHIISMLYSNSFSTFISTLTIRQTDIKTCVQKLYHKRYRLLSTKITLIWNKISIYHVHTCIWSK